MVIALLKFVDGPRVRVNILGAGVDYNRGNW